MSNSPSLPPQASPTSGSPAVLGYAGHTTPAPPRRPVSMMVIGLLSFLLGSLVCAMAWYALRPARELYELTAAPVIPMPTPVIVAPYDGDFTGPNGLKRADRQFVLDAVARSAKLNRDRREMLDRLLTEAGKVMFPASGPLDQQQLRRDLQNIRMVERDRVRVAEGVGYYARAVEFTTPGGPVQILDDTATLGLGSQPICQVRLDWAQGPDGPAMPSATWISQEMDRWRTSGLSAYQAAILASELRKQSQMHPADGMILSVNVARNGNALCTLRNESAFWITANGCLVQTSQLLRADTSSGELVFKPPANIRYLATSRFATGWVLVDVFLSMGMGAALVLAGLTVMLDWPYAREAHLMWAALKVVQLLLGAAAVLGMLIAFRPDECIPRELGNAATASVVLQGLLGLGLALLYPLVLVVALHREPVLRYYTFRGVQGNRAFGGLWRCLCAIATRLQTPRRRVAIAAIAASVCVCQLAAAAVLFASDGRGQVALMICLPSALGAGLAIWLTLRPAATRQVVSGLLLLVVLSMAGGAGPTTAGSRPPRVEAEVQRILLLRPNEQLAAIADLPVNMAGAETTLCLVARTKGEVQAAALSAIYEKSRPVITLPKSMRDRNRDAIAVVIAGIIEGRFGQADGAWQAINLFALDSSYLPVLQPELNSSNARRRELAFRIVSAFRKQDGQTRAIATETITRDDAASRGNSLNTSTSVILRDAPPAPEEELRKQLGSQNEREMDFALRALAGRRGAMPPETIRAVAELYPKLKLAGMADLALRVLASRLPGEEFVSLLELPDGVPRQRVVEWLNEYPGLHQQIIWARFNSPDPAIRRHAVEVARAFRDRVYELMDDPDPGVRREAILRVVSPGPITGPEVARVQGANRVGRYRNVPVGGSLCEPWPEAAASAAEGGPAWPNVCAAMAWWLWVPTVVLLVLGFSVHRVRRLGQQGPAGGTTGRAVLPRPG